MALQTITTSKSDRLWRRHAQAVAASDAALWAETSLMLGPGQPFSFRDHVYQIEPMTLEHARVSVRKATQGGWTLIYIAKSLHGLTQDKFPAGVIYLFPTDVKVSEFSRMRFTPLIDTNPLSIGRFVRNTDRTHIKQVGSAMLMFRGARLTQRIGGMSRESAALRSDPADVIVFDERDLMPPYAVSKALKRMAHSRLKWELSLSNPTIPRYGIDACWTQSDQRHWMVRCPGCNHWQCMEVEFPAILRRELDGTVIRACVRCGAALDIDNGQWSPKYPDRSPEHVGYWWSQLNSHYVSAAEILRDYEHPPENNIADFYRLTLGMPYLEAESGLTAQQVLLCCGSDPPASGSLTPTSIGVDVGKRLHAVIGTRTGGDSYRIIATLVLDGWHDLHAVARAYHAEVTCIDNQPEMHAARRYQSTGMGEIWLSDYVQATGPAHYDLKTRVVKVNRTEILDDSAYTIRTAGKLLLPAPTQAVELFAQQCANMAKVVETKEGTGEQRAVYIQLGEDHFRHAFVNFLLAAKRQVATIDRARAESAPSSAGDFDLFE